MERTFPLEIKSVDDGEGTFVGLGSVYGVKDDGGDIVVAGALTKTVREHPIVPLFWGHDVKEVIGKARLEDTPTALVVHGKILCAIQRGSEVYQLIKEGIVKGLSIGYSTLKADIADDGTRLLQEIRLWEMSIVPLPMLQSALITDVKAADEKQVSRLLDELMFELKHANSQYETRQRPPRMSLNF